MSWIAVIVIYKWSFKDKIKHIKEVVSRVLIILSSLSWIFKYQTMFQCKGNLLIWDINMESSEEKGATFATTLYKAMNCFLIKNEKTVF
jgi:hypothetical protein